MPSYGYHACGFARGERHTAGGHIHAVELRHRCLIGWGALVLDTIGCPVGSCCLNVEAGQHGQAQNAYSYLLVEALEHSIRRP